MFLNAAILGMNRKEIEARYDEIVAFSEIEPFIDQEVKHYSSGMFMRLAFSVAIHVELDILLVDEILSVGDAPFREKCRLKFAELIAARKTLVVVSHDMEMVRELCSTGDRHQQGRGRLRRRRRRRSRPHRELIPGRASGTQAVATVVTAPQIM